ncbi:receptor-type tyrosine-protein phosphatase mu-like, partial [Stegastes partitus]|uniref:protein-tyrosine-phosphatase n=1 Tax=Stegastes partitus TaxID=144197 RepID=A0A9Y4TZJ9_9TELE
LLGRVITGDESWIEYNPETKRQSLQWKSPTSPRLKTAGQSKSKVLLIAFFDVRSIIYFFEQLVKQISRQHGKQKVVLGYDAVVSTCPPAGSSFLFVNTSGRYGGQRAQLLLPPLKENDTHCVSFLFYQAGGREGATPATLNVYIRENNSPLAVPVFNSSGPAYHIWKGVELAVSTFWPNHYQVVFEAVSTGQRGILAIKDIMLQGHQCMSTPHFLHIKGVEVNAGQSATFHCTVNGRPQSNLLLYLQGMGGRHAVVKETKPVNSRRYVASFDVENTTKGDSGRYRCIAQSERGVGVSSYADLTVKQPPVPIAPPQLTAVGATYLWIQLNANSINGDGPIIEREVEYRTMAGMLIDTTPVDKPTHKIGHLDPDTEYEISVLLTRPLEGGTGNPGPPLRARTKCADPMHGPQHLEVVDIQSKQVTVRWEPFGYNVTRCHSYNLTVQYRYRPAGAPSREPLKNELREEVVYDTLSNMPQHTVRNLPPFTNVSLRLVLTNPEGRKESEELLVLTDEDVPGAVPVESIVGSSYEQQISLSWGEPLQTYGLIRQYEISYKALSSFDTEFDLSNQSGKVFKLANETSHMFAGLSPGSTYSFTIRASTVKGFGPPVITQFTTKISAPLMPAYDQESPLNQTDSTVTVLLKPAQSRGAPVSKYQVVVEEERPRRQRRGTAEILRCYPVPIHFQNATLLNSQYYFSAELPMSDLRVPIPFCVGDNRTYSGYWNAPLLPHKSYGIYYQAVSTANGETKIDCVRVATKAAIIVTQLTTPYIRIAPAAGDKQLTGAATRKPEPEQEKQSDHTVKIAGSIAGVLLFIIIFLGVILLMKKRRRNYHSYTYYLKLAKKRKETLSSRQEMTLMVNNSQHTTMVDTHTVNGRTVSSPSSFTLKTNTISTTVPNSYYPDDSHTMTSETSSLVQSHYKQRESEREALPYQTGQLHPAIRVADLLQHITQMKCAEGYGFKEEYESFFEGQSAPWDSAKKDENRMKNRYGNIIAYDHSRVRLQPQDGDGGSDYINANYVDGYHRPNHYIATQGPMQETVYDFWRMVWQENTAAIVMVTNLVEVGRVSIHTHTHTDSSVLLLHSFPEVPPSWSSQQNQTSYRKQFSSDEKVNVIWAQDQIIDYNRINNPSLPVCQLCPQYWPENGLHRLGSLQVEFVSADLEEDVISRIFRIYNTARPQDGYRMVQQFQFLGWPMYRDTPVSKRSFLKLVHQVDKWQDEYDGGEGRTVVHCLNGGGRSGVFCSISIVCEMLRQQRCVDVFHAVKTLRNNKPNMVDLLDQYKFCYEVALEYLNSA